MLKTEIRRILFYRLSKLSYNNGCISSYHKHYSSLG